MFVDAVDSYYQAVKARIRAFNSERLVMGMLEAQDWPTDKVKMEAFYLLTLGDSSAGIQSGSIANPHMSHLVQWVWLVQGSDLAQNQRMRNRGDRFRLNQTMKGELIQGFFPQFTEKKTWTMSNTGVWSGASLSPVEFISWTRPQFASKLDKESGLVYASASMTISDMLGQISA